jgi:hypothetical protein
MTTMTMATRGRAAIPPAAFVWFVLTTIVKSPVAPAASESGPVMVT